MNALRKLVRLESLYCQNNEESEYDTKKTGLNDGFSLNEDKIVSKKFLHVGNDEIHRRVHVEFQSTQFPDRPSSFNRVVTRPS